MSSAHNQKGRPLTPDDLRGDHRVAGGLVPPDLQLATHLAPGASVAPHRLAAVVTARARDVVALPYVGAEYAGHHAAEVQQRHAAAPAVVGRRLALQAGEAEEAAATGAHVAAAVTQAGAPCPRALVGGRHCDHLRGLLVDGHARSIWACGARRIWARRIRARRILAWRVLAWRILAWRRLASHASSDPIWIVREGVRSVSSNFLQARGVEIAG